LNLNLYFNIVVIMNNISACLPYNRGFATESLKNFFSNVPKVYHTQLKYNPFQVALRVRLDDDSKRFVPVGLFPSKQVQSILYTHGTDSKVGKGSETVLDKNVRRSKEYNDLIFEPGFLDTVRSKVVEGLKVLKAGELRDLNPHKLIIYGPGDFFSEHMDSVHIPEQTLTCVVVLSTEWKNDQNCDFIINRKEYTSTDCSMYLFHQDDTHEVPEIEEGYRISLTFDLVVDPTQVTEEDVKMVQELVERIQSTGARRFGFFACHTYLCEEQNTYKLKGDDQRLVQAIKHCLPNVSMEILNLIESDNYDWCHPDIHNFVLRSSACSSLLREVYSDSDSDSHCDYPNPSVSSPRDFEPEFKAREDSSNEFAFVKDSYKLGDVLVLYSPHKPKMTYHGNQEIHLGNEGFFGSVHENVFFLFQIE